jgi:hypothetical protein
MSIVSDPHISYQEWNTLEDSSTIQVKFMITIKNIFSHLVDIINHKYV